MPKPKKTKDEIIFMYHVYKNGYTLEEVAEHFGMSRNWLSKLFAREDLPVPPVRPNIDDIDVG